MAAYTGSVIVANQIGRFDEAVTIVGKAAWTSTITNADTFTISNFFPRGKKLEIIDVTIYGTVPDTNATPTTSLKAGVTGDDDAFLAATVSTAKGQLLLKGTGASIGETITGATDVIITTGGTVATGAASGAFFISVTVKEVAK